VTSEIRIRPSRDGDIVAIRDIYAHAVEHGTASFELTPPDVAEMTARRKKVLEAGGPYLVAEQDGVVIGYSYAGPYRPRPAYRFTVENSIYVAPDRAGQGIGRRLIDALVEAATAAGYRQMIAVIGDSANAASITLHSRAGFRMIGTFEAVGFKFGRWIDSVYMQRALGDGAGTTPPPGR
jgi:phosphinothricin acetyltransferase